MDCQNCKNILDQSFFLLFRRQSRHPRVAGHRAGVMKKMKTIFCSSHFQKHVLEREESVTTLDRGLSHENECSKTSKPFILPLDLMRALTCLFCAPSRWQLLDLHLVACVGATMLFQRTHAFVVTIHLHFLTLDLNLSGCDEFYYDQI